MTENPKQEIPSMQVTFREFCSPDLRSERRSQISWRLHQSLIQRLGNFTNDRTSDWIAQACLQLLQKLHQSRAMAESDCPVFPYLFKTAFRIALEELLPEPKSNYEKSRRLECTSNEFDVTYLEQQSETLSELKFAYAVDNDYQEAWGKLSFHQRFILEAVAKAEINGYELGNGELGVELGMLLGNTAIKANTIAQHKSRALRIMCGA